jgi:hypothetical protein
LDSILTNVHYPGISPSIRLTKDENDTTVTVLRLDNTAVGGYNLRFNVDDADKLIAKSTTADPGAYNYK